MWRYTTFFPEKITNLVPIVIISSMELCLIGASNGVDICMGKASGLSQNADERARQIAEKISTATGLPLLAKTQNAA
ncbi:hypothetical protein [Wielerella bovis]|uniref:hypothetical protein n=1 Tax=Wielerella bovis TaxID=2917790 RepID=UPI0020196D15|nr:hypothetical protein [Wielerella bovis]MCG7655983.1 hypothetical protein [Wielerella bovis]MCG7658209.1 hypothetical protein [Wielerella bovis]